MKAELKAKFLQHLNQKKQDEGFTLIELVMVLVLIGIMSALALPSLLSRAAKAKQSEAKTFVGAFNRAQQAYRMENTSFAPDATTLKIGLSTDTENYTYPITSDTAKALVQAKAKDETLKSYAGGVVVMPSGVTTAAACQTTDVSTTPPDVNLSSIDGASCKSMENYMN